MKVDTLKRRASSKWKAEEAEPPPEPPAKKKRVVKVHARNSIGSIKKGQPWSEQTSGQSSPAPFARLGKGSPLPIQTSAHAEEGQSLRSIADSGILAASLARSRSKWLSEGIFERYWIKSTGYRKKNAPEVPADNPLTSTMTKLGACQMIAEPHVFDVDLYIIKDPIISQTVAPAKLPMNQGSTHSSPVASRPHLAPNSHLGYAVQGNNNSTGVGPTQPALQPAWSPAPQRQMQTSQPAQPVQAPRQPYTPPLPKPSKPQAAQSAPPAQPKQVAQIPAAPPNQPSQPAQPARKPAQDPVIQMLAQRASVNPELKVLMKIVASGGASKSQLAVFQGHIDDLTRILAEQNGTTAAATAAKPPEAAPAAATPSQPLQISTQPLRQEASSQTEHAQPTHNSNQFQQQRPNPPITSQIGKAYAPQSAPFVPPYRPPPKAPSPLKTPPTIRGIALEFTSPESAGDRYYFPRNALLDYQPYGRLVTVSFLVVRKGDNSRPDYISKETYHQPVTVTFCCANSKTLEPLSRAVASPDQVRQHMQDIIRITKRAPSTTLALRLPASAHDNATAGDTGPSTPNPADRRASLMFPTPARGSPALGPPTFKKKSAPSEEALCQYCFDQIPAAELGQRLGAALTCKTCQTLRYKEAASGKTPLLTRSAPLTLSAPRASKPPSAGPRALVFAKDMIRGLTALAS